MGFSKEVKSKRVLKTLFFLVAMFASLLLFSAPLFLAVADALLPSAVFSAAVSGEPFSSHFSDYDFRRSIVDIPLISAVRSALIICVYSLCDGPRLSRGPYLAITTICSVSSLFFVSFKAAYVFGVSGVDRGGGRNRTVEIGLFVWSVAVAVGHVAVAYRTSCRERRKLLVFKIDIEADLVLERDIDFRFRFRHVKVAFRGLRRSSNKREPSESINNPSLVFFMIRFLIYPKEISNLKTNEEEEATNIATEVNYSLNI